MDRRTNPYAPGAGTPPPELVGRDELIEDAEIALYRLRNGLAAKGLLMVGLRGWERQFSLTGCSSTRTSVDASACWSKPPRTGPSRLRWPDR